MSKHTILFLAANPTSTDRQAVDREARAIYKELESAGDRDRFEFKTFWASQPLDLLRELRKLKPTVVHFSGDGGADGLHFEGPDREVRPVSGEALAETFGSVGDSVKVVVLNACYSDGLAEQLRTHIDFVVGMSGAIDGAAARNFSIGFYGGIGDRYSVSRAFKQGCAAIALERLSALARPQIKVKQGVDADGLVLADPR